jgi:flagellum-specific ATP synthase
VFSVMDAVIDAVDANEDLLSEATQAIRDADLHRRTGRVVDLMA